MSNQHYMRLEDIFSPETYEADSYSGLAKTAATSRSFVDIANRSSVRPEFTRRDYDAHRPSERVPNSQKKVIKMCMDAYKKVGYVRNIIDLMGDFACQGISLVHESKSVESFYQEWFKKVNGKERSERFLNMLYRSGNVVAYRSTAKMTDRIKKYLKSVSDADIKVKVTQFDKRVIPWRYTFFNPVAIDIVDGRMNLVVSKLKYGNHANTDVMSPVGQLSRNYVKSLPPDIQAALNKGDNRIPLDEERIITYFYKKDDWEPWANPMVEAILDDIILLEKLKLADAAAADGAISNIRLWTLGDLDSGLIPNKAAIDHLRGVLASNTGGGTMELVWGPELSFKESDTKVHNFLGPEKYEAVQNSIYAGLGVPPTLTGLASNGGGMTNNFISLKTMVERLQYGREQLISFWEREIEIVRRAMGFRKGAMVQFDQMSLADEASEKNLLIQLADRNIISQETVLERFKEHPQIERVRLEREDKYRDKDKLPEKAGPFHNPEKDFEMEKIDKQAENDIERQKEANKNKPKPSAPNGRPAFKKDSGPRKQRTEKPRGKPGVAQLIVWSQDAFDVVSDVVSKGYLSTKAKPSLRSLTKEESIELESLKVDVLFGLEPLQAVQAKDVYKVCASITSSPKQFRQVLADNKISLNYMPIEEYKKNLVGAFVDFICDTEAGF